MLPNLHQLLLDRLQQQGVNIHEAPALLRDLSKIRESGIGIDTTTANLKLQLLDGTALRWIIGGCGWR